MLLSIFHLCFVIVIIHLSEHGEGGDRVKCAIVQLVSLLDKVTITSFEAWVQAPIHLFLPFLFSSLSSYYCTSMARLFANLDSNWTFTRALVVFFSHFPFECLFHRHHHHRRRVCYHLKAMGFLHARLMLRHWFWFDYGVVPRKWVRLEIAESWHLFKVVVTDDW